MSNHDGLTLSEIFRLVNDYIEVHGGYLGDFTYRTHAEFYPYYCDLDIDPNELEGTTRERFIEILSNSSPNEQIKIVEGVFKKYPPSSYDASLRTEKQAFVEEFQKVTERLRGLSGPATESIAEKLSEYGAEYVHQIWQQALERKERNPEAAITSARTLLESVCKHVLDDLGIEYGPKDDLPKLYRKTSEGLNLAPEQHNEEVFKQILGGCKAVVEGLGAVRNRLGDAHGQGRSYVRPATRHAELAVNLAGATSLFLIQTLEHQTQSNQKAI